MPEYIYKNKRYTTAQLAQLSAGLSERQIKRRLADGWSVSDAISIPRGMMRRYDALKPKRHVAVPARVDDVRLYMASCYTQFFLVSAWTEPDGTPVPPLEVVEDGVYDLVRPNYRFRFTFPGDMTFRVTAYFRRTGCISWPVYECVFGNGYMRIAAAIDENGRRTPRNDIVCYAGRVPAAYKWAMKRRTSEQ